MKIACVIIVIVFIDCCIFVYSQRNLKGAWEYAGWNLQRQKGRCHQLNIHLQRKYDKAHYEAFAIEKGSNLKNMKQAIIS